jgi:mannose-6-phosphate isomerase-like protein (cupin superfamily)
LADQIRWLIDAYADWAKGEGIPIVEGAAIDLFGVETKPWPRYGVSGALVHAASRGDLCNMFVLQIEPGKATIPQRHLYEEVMFVLEGQGSAVVERSSGERRSFEFGKGSLFCLPLNMSYRLFNTSGKDAVRIAVVSNLPMVMKQFRNEDFVFSNPFEFGERWGDEKYYRGEGTFIPTREQRHMWETNLVPDVVTFDHMTDSPHRGKGSKNIQFVLGESTMHAHISEVAVGAYKKAHLHGDGLHILQLGNEGYSLYWKPGEEPRRVDWKYGMVHAPTSYEWHQHFNVSDRPGRYMPVSYGGYRFPFLRTTRENIMHSYETKTARQIEYEDEDPKIRKLFDDERRRYAEGAGRTAATVRS